MEVAKIPYTEANQMNKSKHWIDFLMRPAINDSGSHVVAETAAFLSAPNALSSSEAAGFNPIR